jgi:hypothetical protein
MENIISVSLTFEGRTLTHSFIKAVDVKTASQYYHLLHSQFEQEIIEDELDRQADSYTKNKMHTSHNARMKKEHFRRDILSNTNPVYRYL